MVSGEQKQAGWLGRVAQVLFRMRRRIATGAVIAAALVFGYHAIFGENGLNVYQQRRSEDKSVQKRIDELQKENVHLRQQVQALKTDPDAIEREARSQAALCAAGRSDLDGGRATILTKPRTASEEIAALRGLSGTSRPSCIFFPDFAFILKRRHG